jgi:hypothetical protein
MAARHIRYGTGRHISYGTGRHIRYGTGRHIRYGTGRHITYGTGTGYLHTYIHTYIHVVYAGVLRVKKCKHGECTNFCGVISGIKSKLETF